MERFSVKGVLEGNKVKVIIGNKEFNIGMPNSGFPTPEEFLLASALSCELLTLFYYANQKGLKIENVNGKIEGEIDIRGFLGDPKIPPGFLTITYEIEVKSNNKEAIKELAEIAEKRCPIKDTITRGVKININWKID